MDEPVRAEFLVVPLSVDELSWARELAEDAGKEPADALRSLLSHAVYELRCRGAAARAAARREGDWRAVTGERPNVVVAHDRVSRTTAVEVEGQPAVAVRDPVVLRRLHEGLLDAVVEVETPDVVRDKEAYRLLMRLFRGLYPAQLAMSELLEIRGIMCCLVGIEPEDADRLEQLWRAVGKKLESMWFKSERRAEAEKESR